MPSLRIHQENENAPHFVTLTTIEWLNIFTQKEYFNCIIKCLKFCQKNLGLLLYEYVIMTNHIHLIVQAKDGYKLSQIISSFKRHTTRETIKLLKQDRRKHILVLLRGGIYNPNDQGRVQGLNPEPTYKNKVGSDFNVRTLQKQKQYQKFILQDYKGSIWQETNYPELIESEKFLQQKIDYIYNNPVIKGYVDEPQHYLYSSASNRYLDDNSIIELDNLI
ncbi:MAG: transposase [Patescibacteria group bacterium]|nr:transposase [Patescibacteria group bacterium]